MRQPFQKGALNRKCRNPRVTNEEVKPLFALFDVDGQQDVTMDELELVGLPRRPVEKDRWRTYTDWRGVPPACPQSICSSVFCRLGRCLAYLGFVPTSQLAACDLILHVFTLNACPCKPSYMPCGLTCRSSWSLVIQLVCLEAAVVLVIVRSRPTPCWQGGLASPPVAVEW